MRKILMLSVLMIASMVFFSCQNGSTADPGNQTLANGTANDMVYGTENEEMTSGSSNQSIKVESVTDSVTLSGLVSGTAVIAQNTTWTDNNSGVSSNKLYDQTWSITSTRSIAFTNYSNVAGRSIESGTITVTVSSGTIQTQDTTTPSNPSVGDQVTVTATNVVKTITGTVVLSSGTKTYTLDVNLTVTVNSRITDWTLGASLNLTNPVVQSRNVTVKGTVTINGRTIYNINTTLTKTTPQ